MDDEMLKVSNFGLFLEVSHGWRLDVKDSHCLAGAHDLLSPWVLEWREAGIGNKNPIILFHGLQTIPDYRKGPIPQDIHLHETRLFGPVLIPLDDLTAVIGKLHGNVVGYSFGDNDHATAVDRDVSRIADNGLGLANNSSPVIVNVDSPKAGVVSDLLFDRGSRSREERKSDLFRDEPNVRTRKTIDLGHLP